MLTGNYVGTLEFGDSCRFVTAEKSSEKKGGGLTIGTSPAQHLRFSGNYVRFEVDDPAGKMLVAGWEQAEDIFIGRVWQEGKVGDLMLVHLEHNRASRWVEKQALHNLPVQHAPKAVEWIMNIRNTLGEIFHRPDSDFQEKHA